MSISLVNSASAYGSTATTSPVSMAGANLIVLIAISYGAMTVSDSENNTYDDAISIEINGAFPLTLYYCASPVVSSSMTFTVKGNQCALGVAGFSGVATSPVDQTNSNNAGYVSSFSTSLTPLHANELVIAGAGATTANTTTTYPVLSGAMTSLIEVASTANTEALSVGYAIQTSAAEETATWAVNSSRTSGGVMASFLAKSAGGVPNSLMMMGAGT